MPEQAAATSAPTKAVCLEDWQSIENGSTQGRTLRTNDFRYVFVVERATPNTETRRR